MDLLNCRIVDLTHTLESSVPNWSGGCGFSKSMTSDYDQSCRVYDYQMMAGVGTHMDAPNHFIEGGLDIADYPLEKLVAPVCVVDVEDKAHPDYFLSCEDIASFESEHGTIAKGSLVIAKTGWSKYWGDPQAYRNVDRQGNMHFPRFSPEAAELLVEREASGIGIDTLSPDGGNADFPVHHAILGKGMFIIENLTNLGSIPQSGAVAMCLPLKIRGGTESPLRVIALIEK